jgi:uncharacterized protein (TIGR00369 family)
LSVIGAPGSNGAVESALDFAERSPETTRARTITWQDPLPYAEAGAKLPGLDYIEAVQAGQLPPPPIAVVMNFAITDVSEGRAVCEGEPGEEHYNPIGVVHGGYASTLLDSAMGCAVHTTLPAGVGYTTQTLEVKFVRPITRDSGVLRCEAEVIHRGRRQATVEGKLLSEDGRLLAHGTSTCMILA